MKLLTNKQIREMQAERYNQGLIDANDRYYNQGYKQGYEKAIKEGEIVYEDFCNYILSELEELQYNTWDQDRIRRLKVLIYNKKEFERLKGEK